MIALAVIVSLLFCTGDYIIYFLYDSRYQAAGWMLPILSLGLWPMMLSVTIDKSLYALGKPIYPALGNGLKFLYMLIVVPLSFWNMGLIGIILAIAFNDFPYYIAVNYGLWKEKLLSFSQDIKATTILICLLVLGTAIRLMLGVGYSIDTIPLNL
ncbi:hypothetical protein [Cyanothece sp. BG0011]|uniref:hypothetical protein n=1 Tax=Cyanothece sp. BG0011 TaxID=2082950 RepID=UPI0018E521BF|nr:hypothetical protein [Cyanothece sp. BG0011]